jgi:hypothetical protein
VLREPVHRPRRQLSPGHGRRPTRRCAVGRRPADGARRPREQRRHLHARHRLRLRRRDLPHRCMGTRREHRAGPGDPGRVLRAQGPAPQRFPPLGGPTARRQGIDDALRLPVEPDQERQHQRRRSRPILHLRRRGARSRPLGADRRGLLLRPAWSTDTDGSGMGQGRPHRRAVRGAGAARNGAQQDGRDDRPRASTGSTSAARYCSVAWPSATGSPADVYGGSTIPSR